MTTINYISKISRNEDEDLFENENISATFDHDDYSYVMVDQDEESDYRHLPLASPDRKNNVGCYYSPSSSTELCNGTIQHLSLIRKEMLLSLNKTVNQLMTAIRLQTIELVKYHLVNIKETWARVEHINKVLIDHVMQFCLCPVLSQGSHNCSQLLGSDGAISILVEKGECFLELSNLLLGKLVGLKKIRSD